MLLRRQHLPRLKKNLNGIRAQFFCRRPKEVSRNFRMTAIWKETMKSGLGEMLEMLDKNRNGICKFYFGEEFSGVLADDITDFVNYLMSTLAESLEDFPFRAKIANDNEGACLIVWCKKDEPVEENGYDGGDPLQVEFMD